MDDRSAEIYAVIRSIPPGKVMTYGEVAELAGLFAGHRQVARALRRSDASMELPWQRVVGKRDRRRAQISIREPGTAARQRRLLEREGVQFDVNGFIPLEQYGWIPR